jgi:hypothetical protein
MDVLYDAMQPADYGPSVFAAIQEQLGLKLEASKLPVDTLVNRSHRKVSERELASGTLSVWKIETIASPFRPRALESSSSCRVRTPILGNPLITTN